MTGKGITMRDNAYTYSNGTIQILRMYDAGESLEDIMQATGKTKATIRTTILASGREAAVFLIAGRRTATAPIICPGRTGALA